MRNLFEKKLNKILIGGVLGTAVLGISAFSGSPKGRGFWRKIKDKFKGLFGFFAGGVKEIKKKLKKKK